MNPDRGKGQAVTEAEWQSGRAWRGMLQFVRGRASGRKLRLFMVACCYRVWDCLLTRAEADGVMAAERYADGQASDVEVGAAHQAIESAVYKRHSPADYVTIPGIEIVQPCAETAVWVAGGRVEARSGPDDEGYHGRLRALEEEERRGQVELLRDLFGNPFRPVEFEPRWRTTDVIELARSIYEEKAFERLPILADALMDAGCEDEAIISHCRGEGTHVRGCWVVDLVLGKN
jgi:hypothetical protein